MSFKTSTVNDFYSEEEIESAPEVSKTYSDLFGINFLSSFPPLYSELQIKCFLCLELQEVRPPCFMLTYFQLEGRIFWGLHLLHSACV